MKFAHITLGMLVHYLEKLKIQILCRYSADVEENAKKCILRFKVACALPILDDKASPNFMISK